MSGLGNDDNRTMAPCLENGDANLARAAEGERRRTIAYRGWAEALLFVTGAGMAS
jgi:hypothetical protein